ncbi:hypothetical protein JQM84_08330 [Parabacteroides distasonis]|nr:hypothetical protein [Parabacteroides distasonis]
MNKKLFTLAAGLILGSAFSVANAQVEAPKGAKLDGKTLYFLGTDATHLLKAEPETGTVDPSIKWTTFAANAERSVPTDLTSAGAKLMMWKISVSEYNGSYVVKFVNAETGQALSFKDADGDEGIETDHKITAVKWEAVDDVDGDGVPEEYNADGSNFKLVVKAKELHLTGTTWSMDDSGTADLKLFVAKADERDDDKLNSVLGDGFALSFPDVDPQPATNIFDQKLTAYDLTTEAPVNGTYYAISTPTRGITNIDDFKASTFVAVSPVKHFGINGLKQSDGVGFDFIAVSGRDLVDGTTEKEQVRVENAIFEAYYADPVNKEGQYTLKLPKVYVKLDPKKDTHTEVKDVYVDAITTVGVTYVTTTKDKNVQKLTASETNKVKAADILKTNGPAVFNIQFLSGKDNITAAGGSEYGKYLGLRQKYDAVATSDVYELFAEGSAYLNLDAPQNQWVVSGVNGTTITFESRENEAVTFNAELRKTDTENVYELTSTNATDLTWGTMDRAAGYITPAAATNLATLGTVKVKLVPAVIDAAAGVADFTKDELAKKAVLKFNVADTWTASELYVTANATNNLAVTKESSDAIEWTLVKNTAATDSITDVLKYAYQATVDKKVVVKTDRMVDKAFVSYKLTTKINGVVHYLMYNAGAGTYDLIPVTAGTGNNFIIKKNVNGTVSLVVVGATNSYNTTMANTAKALVYDILGTAVAQDYAVVPNLTGSNPMPVIEITEPTTSLETVSRHASFQGVNGGYIAVGEGNQAVIAAATDEAANLTFWLDTADVEEVTPSFYISQSPSVLKANVARNFLWNPADSAEYYNSSIANYVSNPKYYYNNDPRTGVLKAIFKEATLINADSLTTTAKDKLVEVDAENGLENFKFQILLADEAVEGEYVIRSVADGTFLSNVNGKLYLADEASEALVVTLGEGDATANEAIEATGVQVIGGKGAVTVQGAAGKVITVANVLGQTIANQVAASDNVTIAAPAGIVVVAVEGEATKVVVK